MPGIRVQAVDNKIGANILMLRRVVEVLLFISVVGIVVCFICGDIFDPQIGNSTKIIICALGLLIILIGLILYLTSNYHRVPPFLLIRTIDNQALMPGEWYKNPRVGLEKLNYVFFLPIHFEDPDELYEAKFKRGLKVVFTFEVQNLSKFASQMAKHDFGVLDLIHEELEVMDDLIELEREELLGLGNFSEDDREKILEINIQLSNRMGQIVEDLVNKWGIFVIPSYMRYPIANGELCVGFSVDETPSDEDNT